MSFHSTSFFGHHTSTPFGGNQPSPSGTTSGSQAKTRVESCVSKQPSYVATRDKDSPGSRIHSISAMPAYLDKSHEELRWQIYQSRNKGDPNKTPNIFTSPSSIFNHNTPFQPFTSNLPPPKTTYFNTPTISVSPFSQTSLYPSQSQTLNPFSSTQPFRESMQLVNSDKCPTTFTTPSAKNYSSPPTQCFSYQPLKSNLYAPNKTGNFSTNTTDVNPFSHINLCIPQPTPVSSPPPTFPTSQNHCPNTTPSRLDSWPFTPRTSQTAEKLDSVSNNDQTQPLQASNGFTKVAEFGQQQTVPSSLVLNPFASGSPIARPKAVTSKQYGISSLPVSNSLSTNRRTASLFRIRHVASRHPWLPSQKPSCENKVPFFFDEVDKPAPFLPRENPRAWIRNSFSLHSHSNSKGNEDNQKVDNILAKMPKLPEGGSYYTEPSVTELAAKEIAEPGWCTRVNDFVVGRRGYGSIKLLGESDVSNLDIESIVQFNDREIIVYPEQEKKPAVGQGLNKPCEITLLNVKCMDKKSGKPHVDGPQLHRFKEMLMDKCREEGAEFVYYDALKGEWKFRVQHF